MTPTVWPLQTILAATDFSHAASMAAQRAAMLAREHQTPLHLLHVISTGLVDELRAWLDNSDQWQARMAEQTRGVLDAEAHRLAQAHAIAVTPRLLEGPPVNTICAQTEGLGAGLLVAGARGSNRLHHLLIGTTTERLLRKTSTPLLVVRQAAARPYQRVLVPLDFSPWSEGAVLMARRIAPGAHLVLMHSFTIAFEEKLRFAGVDDATLNHYRERARRDAREHLDALVERHALPPQAHSLCLTEGDAPQHIRTQARARGCDLIVIGKHGRQAAEELLLGSVTKHVIAEAECDVLVSTVRSAA